MSEPVTIFDIADDAICQQRRCGFFTMHDINPSQVVAGSAEVTARDDDTVEVSFLTTIPSSTRGFLRVEDGYRLDAWRSVMCDHGGEPHRAVQRHSIIAHRTEVSL